MIARHARALPVLVSVLVLALAGCGAGGSSAPDSEAPPASAGDDGGGEAPEPATSFAAVGDGSCTVDVTGAVSSSWKTPQDESSVLVSYWLSDSEREESAQEGESFLVNCDGGEEKGYINLAVTPGTTAATFTHGPATYEVVANDVVEPKPGQVSALLTLPGGDYWGVAAPGSLKVTRLDGSRFAATYEFTAGKLDSAGGGDNPKPEVTVKGSFDFSCTTGGCK